MLRYTPVDHGNGNEGWGNGGWMFRRYWVKRAPSFCSIALLLGEGLIYYVQHCPGIKVHTLYEHSIGTRKYLSFLSCLLSV